MFKIFSHSLILVIFVFSSLVSPLMAKEFHKRKEREIMLELYDLDISDTIHIQSSENTNPDNLKFVEYYVENLGPDFHALSVITLKSSVLDLLLKRALYNSEEEQNKWEKELNSLSAERVKIITSKSWKEKIIKSYELSKNLSGPLVEVVRMSYEHETKFSFDGSYSETFKELAEIRTAVDKIANTSPFIENVNTQAQVSHENQARLLKGEIDFKTAAEIHKNAFYLANIEYGHDVAEKSKDLLNRQAIIHSKLAKAKGYNNWAEFVVAQSADRYSETFQTVDGQIEYLEQILEATDKVYAEFLNLRKAQFGLPQETTFFLQNRNLLDLSYDPTINEYFLKENFIEIWHTTMELAGFSPDVLSTINIDSKPRSGKATSAFLYPVLDKTSKVLVISADDLTIDFNSDPATTILPQLFWVQNDVIDGLKELKTTFHEGGHALDFVYREPVVISYETPSYNETHSTFMESFLMDYDFLITMGKNIDGEPVPPSLVESYLDVVKINALIRLRYDIGHAIFDLKLWNHDYESNNETFIDRARRIYEEVSNRANLLQGEDINGLPWQDRLFTTNHFYDGSVSYLGYITATVAADVILSTLKDHFETTTGRRSIFNQPNLADTLVNGVYKYGREKPFPENIESFARTSVSPENFGKNAVKEIETYIEKQKANNCSAFLTL